MKKGSKVSLKIRKRIGQTLIKKGIKPPLRTGSIPWNKGLIYSQKLKNKISKAVRTSPNLYQGKRHHFWKGGITKKYEKLRKSYEYKLWRKSVFERDNYTCVFCKRKKEISGQL